MKNIFLILSLICLLSIGGPLGFGGFSPDPVQVPRMSKEVLKTKLGSPNLVVIDLRKGKNVDGKEIMVIAGAVREDPLTPEKWTGKYGKDKELVIYCGCKEDKLSIMVAEKLIRMRSQKVYVLEGGWKPWLQAGYPTERK